MDINQFKINKYYLASIIAVGVILFNQIFIQYWLYQKAEDAKSINVSGRQRMLSQAINLEFERVYQKYNQEEKLHSGSIHLLKQYFIEWQTMHQALQFGNDSLEIKAINNSNILDRLQTLDVYIEYIDEKIKSLENDQEISLDDIYVNQSVFLSQMNAIVKTLEKDSDRKLNFIIYTEIILALISIGVILAEANLIYFPIYRRLTELINRLKKSERNLKAIHDASIASLTFIGPDFKILYTNKKAKEVFRRLLGKDATIGDSILDYYELDTQEEFARYFKRALNGENIQIERFLDRAWWLIIFYPVYDNDKIIGIVKIRQDITTIKLKDAILEKRTHKLMQIAWDQSHLIRSPLANILGMTGLLLNQTLSEEDKTIFLGLLDKEAKRLDEVIHRIVNLADVGELDLN